MRYGFAMYIKELLSIKGITQKELAERISVSLSDIKQMVLITTATLSNSPFPILSSFANIGKNWNVSVFRFLTL